MKYFKLHIHQKNFSGKYLCTLLLNAKEFPQLGAGDVVEIYHPEDENSRLLLQYKPMKDELQKNETVSIAQSIATNANFNLKLYKDVIVNKVVAKDVALDLVELTYREQYFSRADMWRLRKSLINSCLYMTQKIRFAEMKAQVAELWSKADKVACGYVTDETRVTFRSMTAQVNIFIQMSSEMWEFDNYGDLYFEKTVDGYLVDLFNNWKKNNCNHDVTITMFSRSYYKAESIDEFPMNMRECVQQDYLGRFYEDFYRVVVQNERYDDWTNTLIELKRLFNEYRQRVLNYHDRACMKIPEAWISSAAQGNFLETLNMALNVFEKYYLDRNFDRTGKLVVMVTPGPGVFEVDRDLTYITKLRTIDCGNSSDLVCIGEQPLHAVPLFKFHNNRKSKTLDVGDDYNIPHWINHSFYTSKLQAEKIAQGKFLPRIKLLQGSVSGKINDLSSQLLKSENMPFVDYVQYDSEVFKQPTLQSMMIPRVKYGADVKTMFERDSGDRMSEPIAIPCAQNNAAFMPHSFGGKGQNQIIQMVLFSLRGFAATERSENAEHPVGSVGSPVAYQSSTTLYSYLPRRALINPFQPSYLHFKVTSNRRRWAHAFPTDPKGASVQLHHQHSSSGIINPTSTPADVVSPPTRERRKISESSEHGISLTVRQRTVSFGLYSSSSSYHRDLGQTALSAVNNALPKSNDHNWLWGVTGEQEWTPDVKTGMDWKSMTGPASLPLTTDFFPSKESLKSDYVVAAYTLLPDIVYFDRLESGRNLVWKKPLSTIEVYNEMIGQRIAQGFQIVITVKAPSPATSSASSFSGSIIRSRTRSEPATILSIGRIFHRLTIQDKTITVTKYWPRHIQEPKCYHYTYRFQVPDSDNHDVSWTDFTNEKLEQHNWNHVDHFLISRGDDDHGLMEELKYWRARFFLLPFNCEATKRIAEGGEERCDIYEDLTLAEQRNYIEGFLRFVETANKIRRPIQNRLARRSSLTSPSGFGAFLGEKGSVVITDGASSKVKVMGKVTESLESPPVTCTSPPEGRKVFASSNSSECFLFCIKYANLCKSPFMLSEGLNFLKDQTGVASLPANCFVSAEAVSWIKSNVDAISSLNEAIDLLQRLLQDYFICHASGNRSHHFIYGFYLYYIVSARERIASRPSLQRYFRFWFCFPAFFLCCRNFTGILIRLLSLIQPFINCGVVASLSFLQCLAKNSCRLKETSSPIHKTVNVDVDPNSKSDRDEWGIAHYHAHYTPTAAFELVIQWLVATGCILGDLVSSWARKATTAGFHLLPIPGDPFALPFTPSSDPLRGPIFVPLNIECLKPEGEVLFQAYNSDTREERLILFQDSILRRFGFLPDKCPVTPSSATLQRDTQAQYVHRSGGMFAMIPDTKTSSPRNRDGTHRRIPHDSHKEYIAQRWSLGFLWSWNFMLTKRWRSSNTGDEVFQDKVLADFRAFCANSKDRLKQYWDSCYAQHEQSKLLTPQHEEEVDDEDDSANVTLDLSPKQNE
ncbi:hypothetical protein CAPTEDRAFT_139536 [Capitella teleta]|uniref:DEP domain-containing protein n=1 Tax=Capitella teleta TaxID=283909 RepID=R7TJR0_CAPTE|nr:hypothetical protein CAPTEDRAFT_139536 [Capitella teleta]|eukprot:ELT94063.1 hypothetical protein CAPTEDRAFT_139536 [Capitella teleta]